MAFSFPFYFFLFFSIRFYSILIYSLGSRQATQQHPWFPEQDPDLHRDRLQANHPWHRCPSSSDNVHLAPLSRRTLWIVPVVMLTPNTTYKLTYKLTCQHLQYWWKPGLPILVAQRLRLPRYTIGSLYSGNSLRSADWCVYRMWSLSTVSTVLWLVSEAAEGPRNSPVLVIWADLPRKAPGKHQDAFSSSHRNCPLDLPPGMVSK